MKGYSRQTVACRKLLRCSSFCGSRWLIRVIGTLTLALCAALSSLCIARADQPFRLSKSDISALYRRWETIFGNSDIETVMRIRAKTITIGDGCHTPYTILDVRKTTDGKLYIVEIKEAKPGTLGAHIEGKSNCLSDGLPYVALRLSTAMPPGGSALDMLECASYNDLKMADEPSASEGAGRPQPHRACGEQIWSPIPDDKPI